MNEGHRIDTREMYEASRLGAYLSILPHIAEKDRQSLTPQKLFKFEWETEIKKSVESIEADKEHFRKMRQIIKEGRLKPKE